MSTLVGPPLPCGDLDLRGCQVLGGEDVRSHMHMRVCIAVQVASATEEPLGRAVLQSKVPQSRQPPRLVNMTSFLQSSLRTGAIQTQ